MSTLLGAAPALSGQEDGGRALAPAAIGRASVGMRAFPDRLVGVGPDYRLELRSGGATFVPALGSRAERLLPVEFALESVTVGGVPLPIAAAGVAPEAEGTALLYRRGAGVTERYDLLRGGVEQSFVLADLPAARGEVVVSGRLSTELPLASADERAGLAFALPGLGGVRIGGVLGVDAAGRTAPGRILLSGDRLELRLDAGFVAQAALPLTLDPLIAADIAVNEADPDDGDPDVGYDEEGGYLVVWTRTFTAGDTEIRGQLIDEDGTLDGGLLLISSSGDNTAPAVGSIQAAEKFIVAWEHDDESVSDKDVLVAAVGADGSISPETPVGATDADESQADAGASFHGCPVVWRESGGGIRGANITLDAFDEPVVSSLDVVSTGAGDHDPAVGSPGDGLYSLVVWSTGAFVNDQIQGVRWLSFGTTGDVFTIHTTLKPHGAPDCAAADDDDFMVVWSQQEQIGLFAPPHDVFGARVLFPGSDAQVQPAFAIENDTDDNERSPAIAYAKYEYIVAYLDDANPDDDLFAKALDPMTGQMIEQFTIAAPADLSPPALAGGATMSDSDELDDVLAVYAKQGADGDIQAGLADGVGGTQEEVTFSGCFLTGDPRASAAHSPNAKHRHELWDAEPGVPCILGVGWAQDPIDLGEATLVPDLEQMIAVFAGVSDANGFAGVKVPIPEGLAGTTFWFQWATIPSAGACTSLGIDLADALEIVVE